MTDLDTQSEEIRGARGKRESGGASAHVEDRRVSQAIAWLFGALGTGLVGALLWVASSITSLNNTATRLVTQNETIIKRLDQSDLRDDRQDVDIRDLERGVSRLDGRNMRGGPHVTR